MSRDWRLPENRREAFQRFYTFHLTHKAHPGMVYSFLPAIAEAMDLDEEGRAWLVWLNGNTQNAVTSLMLLEVAPRPSDWRKAVDYWNDNFKLLEWDTDRRHQKSKFGVATEAWANSGTGSAGEWLMFGEFGWGVTWQYSLKQPYMGRLSAWSMMEYARILLGDGVPDIGSFMLEDKSGSNSHRNGLCHMAGYDAVYWEPDAAELLGIVPDLNVFAEDVFAEALVRNPGHPDVSYLTMESALCTWKSFHKVDRRYPGVYADMMAERIWKAEQRFKRKFDLLWETRKLDLPEYLRVEDNPDDPGLSSVKQNWYRLTGEIPVMGHDYPDMWCEFDDKVQSGFYGTRKEKKWL